jgi:flagellar biogenesis protein FliO
MSGGSTVSLALRMVFSLGVVVIMMVLVARFMRKRGIGSKTTKSVDVTVLGRRGLGKHTSVTVVEAAGRKLILGVTDQRVTLLADATNEFGLDHAFELELERDLLNLERHGTALPLEPKVLGAPADSDPARKGLLNSLRDMTVRRV